MQKFYRRHRHTLIQFLKFGAIGGSGLLVNSVLLIVFAKILRGTTGLTKDDPFVNLLGSEFHVRWYHVLATLAFIGANVWNFQLNRTFTFKSGKHAKWLREFVPFFLVGALSFAVGLCIMTLLMNPKSLLALPRDVFDSSSGLRDPMYWANLIQVLCVTPLNFLFSKVWAFKAVRSKNLAKAEAERARREALAAGEPGATPVIVTEPVATSKPPCAD